MNEKFIIINFLFNEAELNRIRKTATDLGLNLVPDPASRIEQTFIIGLNPDNRPEVEAFFSLANVDIGQYFY